MDTAGSSPEGSMPQSQIAHHQLWSMIYDIKKCWSTSATSIQSDILHSGYETIAHARLARIRIPSSDSSILSNLIQMFKQPMLPRSLKVLKLYGRVTSIEVSIRGIGFPNISPSALLPRKNILGKTGGTSVRHRLVFYNQSSVQS